MSDTNLSNTEVVNKIFQLIDRTQRQVAQSVNSQLTLMYWNIGRHINEDILEKKRAEYGKGLIADLSRQLTSRYGRGFTKRNLHNFIRFSELYPNEEIVHTLSTQLSWSHIRTIIQIDSELKRSFYTEMCKRELWSVRTLQERMSSKLYERTAISKKPEKTILKELQQLKNEGKMTFDLSFRDPYVLDFLGLNDTYSEKDLESAILTNLQKFIVEMGSDFAFLARQKRIIIDGEDFYIDLLFYHRGLRSLVAIDLKLNKFKAAYKGQMELYLRWLERNEMRDGENAPIGLILCSKKSPEQINYLLLDQSNQIKVAEYLTLLPSKEILEEKLKKAIELASNTTIE